MRHLTVSVFVVLMGAGMAACTVEQPDAVDPGPEDAATTVADGTDADTTTPRDTADRPADPRSDAMQYTEYRNEQYNLSITYPAAIMSPQATIGEDRGREIVSESGDAGVVIFAVDGADQRTLQSQYQEQLDADGSEVTYNVLRDDWFVVSGFDEGDVFYQRTQLSGDTLKTFRIRYAEEEKDFYDPVTAIISRSFGR